MDFEKITSARRPPIPIGKKVPKISKDLKKRGMTFIGSIIIYSYLQAIGIIYSHDKGCYLHRENTN